MITALVYLMMLVNAVLSVFRPWVGVVASYLMALLTPYAIWWWAFESIRPMYWILLPTFLGFGIAMLRGHVDFSRLNTRIVKCVMVLFVCSTIAFHFGPYVHVINPHRFFDASAMYSALQKTYLTFFVAVLLIDNVKKLKWTILAGIVSVVYLTYWANAQYLIYHKYGRMAGPVPLNGYNIYHDENVFATLFVLGFPFVFYLGKYVRSKVLAWVIWAIIPFTWHAIFLTASRGALLAIVSVLGLFAIRQKYKSAGLLVLVVFAGIFAWQAGDVMRSRSSTISEYQQDDSASLRIDAWKVAMKMMMDHPLTGVGLASFGQAYHVYSDKEPRIAHNTFFQIAGDWGLIPFVTYIFLVITTLNALRKNGNLLRKQQDTQEQVVAYYLNEACLYGMTGLVVCSVFLSLEKYDMLYYMLMVANSTLLCTGYWRGKRHAESNVVTRRPALRQQVTR